MKRRNWIMLGLPSCAFFFHQADRALFSVVAPACRSAAEGVMNLITFLFASYRRFVIRYHVHEEER